MRIVEELSASLQSVSGDGEDDAGFRRVVERIVRSVVELMGVNEDEVAIFIPSGSDSFRFAAPLPLYADVSNFPARNSMTQQVYSGGAPLVNNEVKVEKPLSIYERAKISERNPRPIQKMLAVPVREGERTLGVLQVSRRGLAVREAGPDFGEQDVEKLVEVAGVIGPHLSRTLPAGF